MGYNRSTVLNVARAELNYREKASNANLDDKYANAGSSNFTKYARDLDALGFFYNGPKQGFAYCDVGVDWCFVKAYGVEAALKLLCQPRYSAGAGCYYSAMYFKQCGQFHGPGSIPQPGDQVFFAYKAGDVSHTGLVESVSGNGFIAIEFNTSDMVARRSYSFTDPQIHGFGRPKYEDEGAAPQQDCPISDTTIEELAQEVIAGKWGIGAERVAALTAAGYDYTVVQQRVNEILAASQQADTVAPISTSGNTAGPSIEETIFNFCRDVLGLCIAAACGVLANVDEESRFHIGAIGDGGTSFGICQWHASRYSSLKSWCAGNGKDYTTLDGQLWYMKHELETTHSAVLKKLKAVEDTAQGAFDAAYVWCSIFEVPSDAIAKSNRRGELAKSKYWPKYNSSPPAQPVQPTQPADNETAADSAYTITLSVLCEGMSGPEVKAAQTLLIARGYSCGRIKPNVPEKADGEFGAITRAAVERFQTDNAITRSGAIDAATMTALLK